MFSARTFSYTLLASVLTFTADSFNVAVFPTWTTCVEKLELLGSSTAVREIQEIDQESRKC